MPQEPSRYVAIGRGAFPSAVFIGRPAKGRLSGRYQGSTRGLLLALRPLKSPKLHPKEARTGLGSDRGDLKGVNVLEHGATLPPFTSHDCMSECAPKVMSTSTRLPDESRGGTAGPCYKPITTERG